MSFAKRYKKAKKLGRKWLLVAILNAIACVCLIISGPIAFKIVFGYYGAYVLATLFVIYTFIAMIGLTASAGQDHIKSRIEKEYYVNLYESDEEEYY